jgi:DNA-binding transcriptional LysR family regulator
MAMRTGFDKIELHLVRILHTLITERSVSRAALKLELSQPAVSAHLRRLRELTGDMLLVRSGNGMVPTPVALELEAPAAELLRQADRSPAAGSTRPRATWWCASPRATTWIRCSCPSW